MVAAPAVLRGARRLPGQYYFLEDDAALRSLDAHGWRLGLVCPGWFQFEKDGRLQEQISQPVLARFVKFGLRVMPLVTNGGFVSQIAHLVLNDAGLRRKAIAQLCGAAVRYGLAGFELDFENVDAADRGAYTAFVAELAERLQAKGRQLSVSVPAPLLPSLQNPQPTAMSLGIDYGELARHADWLSLMAYDEHTSEPGPIASAPWVEACLQHLAKSVPAERLKLGVPFYHRRWTRDGVREGSFEEAKQLAAANKASLEIHREQRESTFRVTAGGGEQTVWVHSAESLKERIRMASRYGLAGFAAWRLGQEDPEFWRQV